MRREKSRHFMGWSITTSIEMKKHVDLGIFATVKIGTLEF
jgi:hypothetical protein